MLGEGGAGHPGVKTYGEAGQELPHSQAADARMRMRMRMMMMMRRRRRRMRRRRICEQQQHPSAPTLGAARKLGCSPIHVLDTRTLEHTPACARTHSQ